MSHGLRRRLLDVQTPSQESGGLTNIISVFAILDDATQDGGTELIRAPIAVVEDGGTSSSVCLLDVISTCATYSTKRESDVIQDGDEKRK